MSEIERTGGRWRRLRVGGAPERAQVVVDGEAPELGQAPAIVEAVAEEAGEAAWRHSGSFIGAGAIFEGTLKLRGDFHIDTEFHGELDTDGKLVVGPNGSVEGDIRAREVAIAGAVVGSVVARRRLTLRAGARVHADLETACLEVEPHAFFQGRTAMTRPQDASRGRATEAVAEPAVDSVADSVLAAPSH